MDRDDASMPAGKFTAKKTVTVHSENSPEDERGDRILFAAAEVYPLIKTGGLADAACFLPAALHHAGHDVRIILPAYGDVLNRGLPVIHETAFVLPAPGIEGRLLEIRLPGYDLPVYLVDIPALFERPGNPYKAPDGTDWPDNHVRFAEFCRVIVEVCMDRAGLAWKPEVLHCNDWHTGLAPALLSLEAKRPVTVFTIHSLAYQGLFPYEAFTLLKLPVHFRSHTSLEFHGSLSFIKGGLVYADRVVTVSPSYAREITTPTFGAGLDGLLSHRNHHLTGILNGVDYDLWDPRHDPLIDKHFWTHSLTGKTANKLHLQHELGLNEDKNAVILAFIGRLTHQKGIDLILSCLEGIFENPDVQMVMLGEGNKRDEQALHDAATGFPGRMAVVIGYDEILAHRIQAGSDILLMPSRFEPCGLTQLYALRYGTIPVVSLTGGLIDTIVDTNDLSLKNHTATGFHFSVTAPEPFLSAILRALHLHRSSTKLWRGIMRTAMKQEFSWNASAEQYSRIYREIHALHSGSGGR